MRKLSRGVPHTRHVEVIMWKRTVNPLLGHQHQVRSVRLGDALANIPEQGHNESGEGLLREDQALITSHYESKECLPS